ncbi:MAG TPA: hypothetical protein VF925_09695, partial [Casimicrobiaceae bacterium]
HHARPPGANAPRGGAGRLREPQAPHEQGQAGGPVGGEIAAADRAGHAPATLPGADPARRSGPAKPGKPPRPRGPFRGPGAANGEAPQAQHAHRPRVNFDEVQPQSNANALPFGHRTRDASGNGARPSGPAFRGGGHQRPGKGPRQGQRPMRPRGDVDGNVAPPAPRTAIDED